MRRRLTHLPSAIATLIHQCAGLIDIDTARDVGVRPERLHELARARLLVRVAEGVYTSPELLDRLDGWARHDLLARAFVVSLGPGAYLTEWSAVAAWQLPTLGPPPSEPVAVRPRSGGRSRGRGSKIAAYGRVRTHRLPAEHRRLHGRTRLVSQEWAAATVGVTSALPAALVVADAVARRGGDITSATNDMTRWPGVTRARWVAEHADPLAESPVETLGRFAAIAGGLPRPVSNAWVGVDGPEHRVDGLWPFHFAAYEADGALKYNNRPDAAVIVTREKEREWRLRRLGLDLARYDFGMAAFQRDELSARFRRLLQDNPARVTPIRWWKHVPGVGPVEPGPTDWPSPLPTTVALPPGWWRDRR
ncbi:type IV toxin-antitoxin system AbiEi family antitoxin domain-containing protein [Phytoactinopolyspora limicola]|uniref:type IV toxin-antitoxin system AbiEi family antitoxin domain-containing protein n=1 Tax=Phytoactinopolyspora limicola TaxID=2715536 RepID=UPI00140BA7FB|nr:type IV toxin-antitoxin system AbiEi family antitoxin domain-containing protein [Phytoactinopolyspora limicola]